LNIISAFSGLWSSLAPNLTTNLLLDRACRWYKHVILKRIASVIANLQLLLSQEQQCLMTGTKLHCISEKRIPPNPTTNDNFNNS